MRVRVLYFAMARDAAGRSGEEILLPEGATVGAARDAIGEKFPAMRPRLAHCRFAVDREFAALRRAIDDLKQTVPIWKKEIYADGSAWIEGS